MWIGFIPTWCIRKFGEPTWLKSDDWPDRRFPGTVQDLREQSQGHYRCHSGGFDARGDARPDSDIDLVIIAESLEKFLFERSWLGNFGHSVKTAHEDWGLVQSLRVWVESGLEVEFGFTSKAWLAEPMDEGTLHVLKNGCLFILSKGNDSGVYDDDYLC
jgi:hypothetical protein